MYDLTQAVPAVKLYNLSTGPNLGNISYWFILESPSGVVYHEGTQAVPDKNGVWNTEFVIPEPIPQIQGHIDWSGSDYKITAYAKDSANTVFTSNPIYLTKICRPGGNKNGQKNNWGTGSMNVMMNCVSGKLLVEDITSYSYNGMTGEKISKNMKLIFPPDSTDIVPAPFEENDSNTTLIPITYNGKNYQLLLNAIYEYDYGNSTFVRIKYKFNACFDINCGTELCSILCWIDKYEKELEENGCTADQREKLLLVTSKLTRALAGIMQPLCGVNVSKLIADIKKITGDCGECESNGGGINPNTSCAIPVDLVVN